ncbi:Caudovirales tail fibre assembly protein [Yersinia intermedia]|uniref:tail fiber assembly protein n=1 Tax=Yersinia intermedia TaxID=631 RepID=UPI0005DEA48F|nr:tail fiber assembly protein [Yersinia intermedia]CNI92032.1 Caudovirales tail fibre assembly protein [Yersinia intermedia]
MKVIVYIENDNACVMSIAPGIDMSIEDIAARDVPEGCEWVVVDTKSLPSNKLQETWAIVDGTVVVDSAKMNAHLIAQAENKKAELLALFWSSTANWRLDMQLDDISDKDKENLKSWILWRKNVETVDTSSASEKNPAIFPEAPAD